MSRIVHFEIPADDTGRAREFWGGLFGYEFQSMEGPTEYYMFQTGENEGGGITPSQGEHGLVTYFLVDDIDASREKIEELGGSVDAKQPIPGMGWFAHAKDTEGNKFSIWQGDDSAG